MDAREIAQCDSSFGRWLALVLKRESVDQGADDEEEPVQRSAEHRILKEQQAGLPVVEICRRRGIGDATFYTWCSRWGGTEVSDARRLKALDEESRKRKTLLVEARLDVATLRAFDPDDEEAPVVVS